MRDERVRMTDVDTRRLQSLVAGVRPADLSMAVLGRRAGDHVTWQTPGGLRRLRVDHVLYQPEREGKDVA